MTQGSQPSSPLLASHQHVRASQFVHNAAQNLPKVLYMIVFVYTLGNPMDVTQYQGLIKRLDKPLRILA